LKIIMPLMHVQQKLSNKLENVLNTIHDIFSKRPKVPKVHSQMQKVITNWNAHHQVEPLITWECFVNSLCSQIHWLQTPLHDQDATIVEKWQKAMAMALHEVGQVIFF
jgi:hypothetical protein